MNTKLAKFFRYYEDQEKKKQDEVLTELRLTEKIYSPSDEYSEEYPYSEESDGHKRYYKNAPIEATPEEYERILKYYEAPKGTNRISSSLGVLAWIIYICGGISGIIIGVDMSSFLSTVIVWVSALITGSLFLGFSEVIRLLHRIDLEK